MKIKKALDLGCGIKPQSKNGYEWHYADIIKRDLPRFKRFNFNNYPYPYKDSSFSKIICYDVLEHLYLYSKDEEHWIYFFKEIERILEPGGIIEIRVPCGGTGFAMEHHTLFSVSTFIHKFNNIESWVSDYFDTNLKLVKIRVTTFRLWNWFAPIINLNIRTLDFWGKYLSGIILGKEIYVYLVNKK